MSAPVLQSNVNLDSPQAQARARHNRARFCLQACDPSARIERVRRRWLPGAEPGEEVHQCLAFDALRQVLGMDELVPEPRVLLGVE